MNINLALLSCEESNKRNGKTKKFFKDINGQVVASTCCDCGEIKLVEEMCKSDKKKYGIDSRCKECLIKYFKTHKLKYRKIDFSRKIERYLKLKHIDNPIIQRGGTKNGYSRVIIRDSKGTLKAISCCDCKKILDVSKFSKGGAVDSTGYRGNCINCH